MPDIENRNFQERSREADEIFGKLPSWIIRWGITVIAVIVLAVIIACCLIRYPQTLQSRIVLTCDNPPSDLVARYSGILDSVYVQDGAQVSEGDLIALINTPAVYADVRRAEEAARQNEDTISIQGVRQVVGLRGLRLGDLQSDWLVLQRCCADYLFWVEQNQAGRTIAMLESQERESKEYLSLMESQRENVSENVGYTLKSFRRDSSLYAENLISQAEYEQSIMGLHAKQNELTSLDASLSNARMSLLDLRRQVLELRMQEFSEQMGYILEIRRCSRKLLSVIDSWKETYAFLAPFSGRVSLQNVWSRGQHISLGDLVASVVREDGNKITGRLKVSSAGFGKVKEGQRVIVRLNGYPYMEFGVLSGVVTSISSVPEQSESGLEYTLTVDFPDGMTTTYHKELPFVQQMDGEAEIVTEDMRLIEQFIRPIRSAFVNH